MGKFFNHYKPDRAIGFAHPYNDRNPECWHYTLGYRGYDIDVERHVSLWQVGIHPRRPELPILRRCQVESYNQEEAVLEAKRRVDALLMQAPGWCSSNGCRTECQVAKRKGLTHQIGPFKFTGSNRNPRTRPRLSPPWTFG